MSGINIISKKILIPRHLTGLLIGYNGHRVHEMQRKCRCKIDIGKRVNDEVECLLRAARQEHILKAVKCISNFIQSRTRSDAGRIIFNLVRDYDDVPIPGHLQVDAANKKKPDGAGNTPQEKSSTRQIEGSSGQTSRSSGSKKNYLVREPILNLNIVSPPDTSANNPGNESDSSEDSSSGSSRKRKSGERDDSNKKLKKN